MSAPVLSEPPAQAVLLDGLAAIAERYDGFLLDQWGVLHDGTNPYPLAVAGLERLRAAGKTIIILSNSGRRGSENEAVLARIGFGRHLYDHLVSAGDDARDALLKRSDPAYRGLGRRCLLIARPGEEHLASGLDLTVTEDPDAADFILNLSLDPETQSVAGWRPSLRRAVARDLPMICGNPDRHRVHTDGRLHEAPGLVALAYEEIGGIVHYHGKPHPRIYASCLALAGLAPDRLLAIGDSLEHDVAGAAGAGIDACFIGAGIHKRDLDWGRGAGPLQDSCNRLFQREQLHPRYCLAGFAW